MLKDGVLTVEMSDSSVMRAEVEIIGDLLKFSCDGSNMVYYKYAGDSLMD